MCQSSVFAFPSCFKSQSFHSPFRRAACFLCSCKESRHRNTPQSIAPDAHSARRVRVNGRVPLTARPCADNGTRAIHRAPPAGVSVRCRRNAMGTRKSRAARSCAPKPERPLQSLRDSFPRTRGKRSGSFRCVAGEGARKAEGGAFDLDPAFDLRVPVCRGEGRPEMLAESRAGCARVRCTHTEVRSTNPGLTSRTRSVAASAASGAHSLWFLSLVRARERNPHAGRARKTEGTRQQSETTFATRHPCSLDLGIPCQDDARRPARIMAAASVRSCRASPASGPSSIRRANTGSGWRRRSTTACR